MRRRALALIALCALAFSGCINIGVTVGEEIPDERVAAIVPGQTTKQDILRWFGAPADYTDATMLARVFDAGEISSRDLVALPFSDLLVYEIDDVNAHVLITVIFNWVRADMLRDRLVIFFDSHDVVLYYGITRQRGAPPFFAADHRAKKTDNLDPVIKQQRSR